MCVSTTATAGPSRNSLEMPTNRAESSRHPQDGPHCDLKFRVEREAFVAEIAMNIVFLDWLLVFEREDSERIDPSELARLSPILVRYFAAQMPVSIDALTVAPVVGKLSVNDPDEVLLPLFPTSGWRGLRKVSFELIYPLKSPPNEIAIVWPAYPPDLLSVLASKPPLEIAAEWTADGLRSQLLFTRSEPGFTWRRPTGGIDARLDTVPTPPVAQPLVPAWATMAICVFVVAFVAAAMARRAPRVALGAGLVAAAIVLVMRPNGPATLAWGTRAPVGISDAAAQTIFETLHGNMYRAFDYDDERTTYDALARSVSGALLEETYL
ncbi:MAG: hypothetical protein DWH74_01100, partial [Planctomycetota bacterium]